MRWYAEVHAAVQRVLPTLRATQAANLALLVSAILAYRLEGRPWSMSAFRERMRLGRFDWRLGVWGLAIGAFSVFGGPLINRVIQPLEKVRLYTAPQEFAAVMGSVAGGNTFLGVPAAGNWWLLLWGVACLIILNIFGEELWWRGIILPRQELALGSYAWVVNGVLWAAFHAFYHSTLAGFLSYVPGTTLLAYVCWKRKSTWPGIIAHTIQNSGVPIMLFKGITS